MIFFFQIKNRLYKRHDNHFFFILLVFNIIFIKLIFSNQKKIYLHLIVGFAFEKLTFFFLVLRDLPDSIQNLFKVFIKKKLELLKNLFKNKKLIFLFQSV